MELLQCFVSLLVKFLVDGLKYFSPRKTGLKSFSSTVDSLNLFPLKQRNWFSWRNLPQWTERGRTGFCQELMEAAADSDHRLAELLYSSSVHGELATERSALIGRERWVTAARASNSRESGFCSCRSTLLFAGRQSAAGFVNSGETILSVNRRIKAGTCFSFNIDCLGTACPVKPQG